MFRELAARYYKLLLKKNDYLSHWCLLEKLVRSTLINFHHFPKAIVELERAFESQYYAITYIIKIYLIFAS